MASMTGRSPFLMMSRLSASIAIRSELTSIMKLDQQFDNVNIYSVNFDLYVRFEVVIIKDFAYRTICIGNYPDLLSQATSKAAMNVRNTHYSLLPCLSRESNLKITLPKT